jgi:hypothetical protein
MNLGTVFAGADRLKGDGARANYASVRLMTLLGSASTFWEGNLTIDQLRTASSLLKEFSA